jgi:hypothetical protein
MRRSVIARVSSPAISAATICRSRGQSLDKRPFAEKEHDHLCARARRLAVMDDEALADDWLAGERFVGGMSIGTCSRPSRDEEQ